MLVVMDDIALPLGAIRAKTTGSSGGHKGLEDILRILKSQKVPRLRIGIGAPGGQMDSTVYVLKKFNSDEKQVIQQAVQTAADAVENWIEFDIKYVMDKFNRKKDAHKASQ